MNFRNSLLCKETLLALPSSAMSSASSCLISTRTSLCPVSLLILTRACRSNTFVSFASHEPFPEAATRSRPGSFLSLISIRLVEDTALGWLPMFPVSSLAFLVAANTFTLSMSFKAASAPISFIICWLVPVISIVTCSAKPFTENFDGQKVASGESLSKTCSSVTHTSGRSLILRRSPCSRSVSTVELSVAAWLSQHPRLLPMGAHSTRYRRQRC
mmetsp:Transcript_40681/g.109949  ORF Transcript_40681/g.109949 Transcript_40681/m.109949 type:complete len:215 (+) Transcript_40681:288-932(+)